MPNLQNQAILTVPNVFETALLQFMLLFNDNIPQHRIEKNVEISRANRIFRIIISWCLLLISKLIAISSPLYFQGLVEKANDADYASKSFGSVHLVIQTSAIGLMIGYCGSKLLSAVVQLISEFVLFPATTSVAEILPNKAFSAALRNAYKRNGTTVQKKVGNEVKNSTISASEKASAAYARRVLDRGLKAANQFLYRSIFSLLPAYVESICIVILISYKTTQLLGVTAAVVAFSFVYITSSFMHYRVTIIRKQLAAEGIANGLAEDSLALAETVASFGTMEIEEKRYADGLKSISKVEIEVRKSFSTLKLMQVFILGLGTTVLMYCAWVPVTYKNPESLSAVDSSADNTTIARNLMLSQSLFAQLCSVLSMVGQHFRDCVSGAEDLRELEEIVRTDALQRQSTDGPANKEPVEDDRKSQSSGLSDTVPPILEVRDLHFGYPPNVYLQERSNKDRKLSDASSNPKKVILKNISFSIPSGGYSIGIVGPSGSGKSTLLRVLLSMESITSNSNAGKILINGVDVSNCDRVPYFSMVGQENDLFRSLNLLENVKYGSDLLLRRCATNKRDASNPKLSLSPGIQQIREKEALANAAMDSQLQPVVDKLKDGWVSAVGPRGRLLSGGERQRVCLARALYRQEISLSANILPGNDGRRSNGCILLMDEVTSSLDAKTESIVIEAIMSRVRKGATAVLIAHRLSSVQQCDMILVMRDGEIIERGTHAELLQHGGSESSSSTSSTPPAAASSSEKKIGRLPKNMSISNIEQKVGWYSEAWSLQSSSSPYPFPQTTSPTLKKKNVSAAIEADQLYSGGI